MAGVRPQVRGGVGGFQIPILWFVGAIVLWTVSTVLLVVLYTDQAQISAEIGRLRTEKSQLLKSGERDALHRYFDRAGNMSVVGILENERRMTTELLTGDGSLDYPAAAKVIQDALRRIVDEGRVESSGELHNASALQAIDSLYQALVGQQDEARRLREETRSLQEKLEEHRDLLAAERSGFQAKSEDLEQQTVQLLRDDYDAFRSEKGREVEDLRRTTAQLREEISQSDRDHAEQREQLETQATRLLAMIERLRDQLSKFSPQIDPELLIKQADGQVVHVLVGEDLAYINLGSKDRLKRGMTFAVYPSDGRLPESGEGKGTLEVVSVHPETAECRIQASVPGDPIVVGDHVGNVVFDKKRSFRFRVTGRFDLDYDGQFDPRGKETIEAMIGEWGGTVVDTIDERTDFVVLGAAPERAPALSDRATSAEQALIKQSTAEATEFEGIRNQAKALSIPLLTQTQFLNLAGFEYTFQGPGG